MKVFSRLLVFLLLGTHPALSQIKKGTIGVVYYTEDKIVMAADSRGTHSNKPPDDKQCKIAALGEQIIFVNSGFLGVEPSGPFDVVKRWQSIEEAHTAYDRMKTVYPNQTIAAQVASEWARATADNLNLLYAVNPKMILDRADPNGRLTSAFFGETTESGHLTLHFVTIVVRPGSFPAVNFDPPRPITRDKCSPCAIGKGEILVEFTQKSSVRARQEAKHWTEDLKQFKTEDRDILWVIRLVDLTIAYDKSGTVGGKIDTLELRRGEGIRWYQRKPKCPAS